ncbi:MAG: hypothetical protein U1E76_12075 [Planctomycetota bacterium]
MSPSVVLVLAIARADDGPHLDLRIEAMVDLYYWVRKVAGANEAPPRLAGFDDAVSAVGELRSHLKSLLDWGVLEASAEDWRSSSEMARAWQQLDESLRAPAAHLARALGQIEAAFRKDVWPGHRELLAAAAKEVEARLIDKESECFAYMGDKLEIHLGDLEVPVYLVAEAPWPQGFTHVREGGSGVCFVGLNGAQHTQFLETILHEATHALDVASTGSVFDDLRTQLEHAGVPRTSRVWHDAPHTLMFIQAGETIRRIVDPGHQHYGDVAGYYPKVKRIAEVERAAWLAYLDGNTTRAEAVRTIVAQLAVK